LKDTVQRIIREAELVASTKITEESIIILVNQILEQFGALPIGEIGKQLQIKTGNDDFPKLLKKSFYGLKKFITAHPNLFRFGDNHNFNPVVYRVDPEKEMTFKPTQSRATTASNPSMNWISSRSYSSDDINNARSVPFHYPQPQQPFSIRVQSSTRQLDGFKHLAARTQPSSPPRSMSTQHFFSQQHFTHEHPASFSLSKAVALKSSFCPSSEMASHQHNFQPTNGNSALELQSFSISVPSTRASSYHCAPIEHMERQHSTRFGVH